MEYYLIYLRYFWAGLALLVVSSPLLFLVWVAVSIFGWGPPLFLVGFLGAYVASFYYLEYHL